ncbi:TIGR00725 family protein [candidate division KSB1 bacterium]|nr:TIGR00725 family protein [candidate division KSB1 bacterium]
MQTSRKPIIGVMGGGTVGQEVEKSAFEFGALVAENGWILLNGGRDAGVMRASAMGAKSKGGLVIGILPGFQKTQANPFIDIPIITGMGDARNVINVLSSDVVVACPGGAGTMSEIAFALKNKKPVILLNFDVRPFFIGYDLLFVSTPVQCIDVIKSCILKN